MKTEDKQLLCSLIRDHEDTMGSSRVSMMAINAFIESIKQVQCQANEIRDLFAELSLAIRDTEPKVIPLIHLIEEFEQELDADESQTVDDIKAKAIRILKQKHHKIETKIGHVVEHGLTCINEGDVIIVHTISYDVTNMLKLARQVLHKNFKVIVLKQDLAKTRRLVKSLSEADIDMEIIPEYSLVHYIGQGITTDMKVVSAVGSANVVSLCHLNQLPIYLFANTLKYSRNPSSKQQIHRKVESKTHGDLSFQLVTHSHDTVNLKHVDYLVTETGIKDKDAILASMNAARS